jgi:flagellar biosynthesis protein FlhF
MRVWKFEGATMRDAIAKVKAELGDQAVIISTRQIRKGLLGSAVEISAAIDNDDAEPAMPFSGPTNGGPMPAPAPRPEVDVEKQIAPLRSELRSLRALVRTSGEGRATTELRTEVAALRKLIETINQPAAPAAPAATSPSAWNSQRRPTPQRPAAPPAAAARGRHEAPLTAGSTGAIVMLVGPTGAGKTTTIAKLAARAALIDGRRVSVVTLDNYRVGGVEQIRMFSELIGVPLQVAETSAELANLLDPGNDLTLIDTAGRSPRDHAAIDELARHIDGLGIEVHLVVPAGSSPSQIDELIRRYSALTPVRLLFTKLDECGAAAELALAPARTRLPITWVTTGQAVPEDIEQPTDARVLELASGGLHEPAPRNRSHRAA